MEDGKRHRAILHSPFSILHPLLCLLYLLSSLLHPLCFIGCSTPRAQKTERAPNYTAYLYSLYDTEWAARPRESLKEDRLELKTPSTAAVASLGDYAPREALLSRLRAQTNLFRRVEGMPAVIDVPASAANPSHARLPTGAVKEHVLKMRQLAGDVGADYLCLVGTTYDLYVIQEPTGVFDLTIIGYFVLGTNRIEVEGRGAAALVDVATGRVVAVVTEEKKYVSRVTSYALQNQKHHAPGKARAHLEELLVQKLVAQLRERGR